MSAVMPKESTQIATSEGVSFIQMIERASRDPAVDIDKMERLMQMHERMMNRQAETAYYAALAAMQTEMPILPERGGIKNKQGGVQSKYVLWEDLNEIIKPILSRHGFALTFLPGNDGAKITVTGVLSHEAGHVVRCTMAVPLDESGSKNSVQGLGSSTSYGKRYVAAAMLNLTSKGEDDDGAHGKGLTDEDVKGWLSMIEACETIGQTETLWKQIAEATTKAGDVPAHETLHLAMATKRRSFKKATT